MKKLIPLFIFITLLSSCTSKDPKVVLTPGIDTVSQFTEYTPNTCMLETKDAAYQMEITTNDVNVLIEGTYTVNYIYTFDDTVYTCDRKVFVLDDTAPEIQLIKGVDTVFLNSEWIDMSVEYSDTNSSSLTLLVDNPVDTSKLGTYIVTYTVTDERGNEGTAYRYVTVVNK